MKKNMLIAAILLCSFGIAQSASAAVSTWQKGMSIRPRWETDYGSESFKQSIDNLAATKSNYVTLVVPLYQDNPWTTAVYQGGNTPTDASLINGIQYIHSKGMRVNLKIHVDTYDGQWRAHINPGDRDAWFGSYGHHLIKYAKIAEAQGVAEMTIGAELINMAANDAHGTNTANWQKLIGQVRSVFSGKVTYSANWGSPGWTDEKNRITFWSDLDYIGVSAYYPLPTSNPNVETFKQEWDKINNSDLRPLKDRYGKPLLFTEVGYRSIDWAHWAPFEYGGDGNYDPEEQADLYEALYAYWNNYDYVNGVHWWDWSTDPNYGGEGNKDFTPHWKPAEGIMMKWNEGGSAPEPTPPPAQNISFSGTARAEPATLQTGQQTKIMVNISNNGASLTDLIVDIEVYDSNNNQVHQTPYTGQNFASGESKQYSVTWNPGTSGTYTIRFGVFNNNWTANYLWVHNAGTIQVGEAQSPPQIPAPDADFSAHASAGNVEVNHPVSVHTSVKNSGGPAQNMITDVEIYNEQNNKVHQTPYNGQHFASGESKEYTTEWTPSEPGNYTVKLGVFNNDWSKNLLWINNAAEFSVTHGQIEEPGTEPNPADTTIQIWWPSDGAEVAGVQPFKAMVEGMNIEDYQMFWSVDGGALNEMFNNYENYPHKEVLVDTSSWRWRDNGQYRITLVVKNKSGQTILEKEITILVF